MINKEIILNADGTIKKDFSDRAIPQNSNNQVSVNVLIPSTCFVGLQNYAVLLAVSRIISNVETTLNTLVMSVSKSITIDGVVYVKYTAYLDIGYTDKLGVLKFSPYIQTTATTMVGDVATEVITIQQSFTNSNLNVIKSVLPQCDASLEEGTIATTLEGQINAKKIYTFVDTDSASVGQHYYELATGYNPSADQFNGCLVVSVYGGWTNAYIPYLNNGNVELLEIIETGMFYKISNVAYSNSTYTFTRTKLSYTKAEIDTLIYKKTETYNKTETDNLLNAKVDKTTKVNNKALSSDITLDKSDVGLGNVANYGVESATPSASGDQLYITSKAVYDALQLVYSALNGYATTGDLSAINTRLDSIEAIIGSDDGDADNVINTLKEVIIVLNGLGEGANLLDLINAKANQSDLTALNNQINGTNGIKDKVDILSERNNAYMEIKNSLGTIDILVSDWVSNTGDTNYPYKWELTNGYLEGAVNCIVVYSKDSDTSMLSATTGIDEENGKLIIYASELPSATISIEKIAVFNDLNSYINYSNEIVQQVLTNTSAISDINNVKLPQYVKATNNYSAGRYIKTIENKNDSTEILLKVVDTNDSSQNLIRVNAGRVNLNNNYKATETKTLISDLLLRNGKVEITNSTWENGSKTAEHTLEFDSNGDLKIDDKTISTERLFKTTTDATESGGVYTLDVSGITGIEATDYLLYINSGVATTLYQVASISSGTATLNVVASFGGGGGKQLYQHNIGFKCSSAGNYFCRAVPIITSNNTAFTLDTLKQWLIEHSFTDRDLFYCATGKLYDGGNKQCIGIYVSGGTNLNCAFAEGSGFGITYVEDNVITL